MARLAKINKNEDRKALVTKFRAKRAELKETIRSPQSTPEQREAAAQKLRALPRDANPNRVKNRCMLTGRSKAVYRKFELCRVALRDLAHLGLLPGVRKSSW